MNELIVAKNPWFSLMMLVMLGCATVTPHDNFINHLHWVVGKNWTWLRNNHQLPGETFLVSSKELLNGNIEKRYKWTMGKYTCTNIYEIDPMSELVVRTGFEGRDEDCVSPP